MVLAVTLFSVLDAIAKLLAAHYPALLVGWGRYTSHVLLMLPLLPFYGGARVLRTARPTMQAVRGALLVAATLCMFTALRYVPLAEATAINFTAPLLVTALSAPLLGERIGWRRWAAVAVGFVGVLVITRPGQGGLHPAALLVLVTATCFALYQIVTRRLSHTDSAMTMMVYSGLVGAVAMSALLPLAWRPVGAADALKLAAMGLCGLLGHLLLTRALALAPASLLAPMAYLQIVGATVLGVALFDDFPDAVTIVGCAIIVASGLYVFVRERRLTQRR